MTEKKPSKNEASSKQNKPKKPKVKASVKLKEKVHQIMDDSFEPTKKGMKIFRRASRVLIAAAAKFKKDEGMIRGTSISYSLIVSFVPTLVVALMIGAKFINIEEYFTLAKEFVRKNGIPLELDAYFQVIRELLNNAGAITGVGSLVMLFSATSVLRNIELALNTIFRVKQGRPFIQKISGFIMVLLLGPAFLGIGISMAQGLISRFASPDLKNIKIYSDKAVVVGDKGVYIERQKNGSWRYHTIIKKVDFESQKDPVVLIPDNNQLMKGQAKERLRPKFKPATKGSLRTAAFSDIERIGNRWWIITDTGSILYSYDNGDFWQVQKYQRYELNLLFTVRFHRIKMFTPKKGIIIGNSGLILRTNDGGDTWKPAYIPGVSEDLNTIEVVNKNKIIILGNSFTMLVSNDGGDTFEKITDILRLAGKDKENLMGIYSAQDEIWVCGQSGLILRSSDGGETWRRKNIGLRSHDFTGIHFINPKNGILIGYDGKMRYTSDGGETWKKVNSPTEVNLVKIAYDKNKKRLFVIGDAYHILANKEGSISEFTVIRSAPLWRKLISALGNFLLPFFVIWFVFYLLYKILPYTEVDTKAAAIGAAVTSVLQVGFLLVFKIYVSGFAKGTFAIYGTLAAIPLSLLMVYISMVILLFGAEIAFYLQFPALLKLSKKQSEDEIEKRQIWYGLRVLYTLYENFEKGKGATSEKTLIRLCNNDQDEADKILKAFEDKGWIQRTEDKKSWTPLVTPKLVKLVDVVSTLDPTDYLIPTAGEKNKFVQEIKSHFQAIEKARQEQFGKETLADLL